MNKTKERIAIFPGSFDPITKGHEAIVHRASKLFDKIIVAIGVNSKKKYLFSLEQRKQWLEELFAEYENVEVDHFQMLTVDYCKQVNAQFILRGLRNGTDFDYEKSIGQMNQSMNPNLETVYLMTSPELSAVNSSIIREIYVNGGNIKPFIPEKLNIKAFSK